MNIGTNNRAWLLPALVILGVLFLYAGGWRWLPHFGGMGRHHQMMMGGVPQAYAGRHNPLAYSAENLAQGARLYRENCAACHGDQGRGDGPAANSLNPPPADLAWLMRMPMTQDDYLYWRISEGGARFGSAMPAFKGRLSESDRWKIIQFLKQL